MSESEKVRSQYDKFPYPPTPWMALPRFTALELSDSARRTDRLEDYLKNPTASVRCLILGSGTFEPVGVATEYPDLASITAVDLSPENLAVLKKRIRLAQVFRKIPPIERIEGDFTTADFDQKFHQTFHPKFQWIRASNVLHHLPDPQAALKKIRNWLAPGGVFRFTVYPRGSRTEMRWLGRYFEKKGIHQGLSGREILKRARSAVSELPEADPRRESWTHCLEKNHPSGVIDAFLHAYETPTELYDWVRLAQEAGFEWIGEGGREDSRVWDEGADTESRARALQIRDDEGLIGSNPVFWMRAGDPSPVPSLPEIRKFTDFQDLSSEKEARRKRAVLLRRRSTT